MSTHWERHDYAARAAALPAVKRLHLTSTIILVTSAAALLLPLIVGLFGAPPSAIGYVAGVAPFLAILGIVPWMIANQIQRCAIARWASIPTQQND